MGPPGVRRTIPPGQAGVGVTCDFPVREEFPGVQSVSLNLEAAQFLAGWRPEIGNLFLPALSDTRVGEEVAVRVGIFGQSIRATLFGRVALVRRVGRPALPPGVEIVLDRTSVAAA